MTTHTEKEIAKFDALAKDFWNPDGKFKTLHQINPIRVNFIQELMSLTNCRVADIGCGGGILSEALDEKGAQVTAIDLSSEGIATAKAHQAITGSRVDYRHQSIRTLTQSLAKEQLFDGVFCLEMLEHVENPAEIISDCAALVKPEGLVVFSTINRNLKAGFLTIVIAEYLTAMVAKGTHEYRLYIKPSEMQKMAEAAGLIPVDLIGFEYHLLNQKFVRSRNTDVNYIFAFRKPQTCQ